MTIRDYIKSNIGETYDKLTDTAAFDGGNARPDVVGMKILAALSRLSVVEDDLNEFQKSHVADHATIALIPIAMDYYMVKTRLVDNLSRPAGVTVAGGEVGQNYDRISALRRIAEELKERVAADAGLFNASTGNTSAMRTDNTRDPLTADPFGFDPIPGSGRSQSQFGVAYVGIEG